MGISPSKLAPIRERVYIPAESFQCIELYDNAGTPAYRSVVNTNVEYEEIGSINLSGFKVTVQVGTVCTRHLLAIPRIWDKAQGFKTRTIWTHSVAKGAVVGDRSLIWDMEYGFAGDKGSDSDLATAEDSLNGSSIYQHVLSSADVPITTEDYPVQVSPSVSIPRTDAIQGNATYPDEDDILYQFRINLSSSDASFVEDIWILGLEVEFSPNRGKEFIRKGRLSWA